MFSSLLLAAFGEPFADPTTFESRQARRFGCFADDGNGKPSGGGKPDDEGEGDSKKPVPYAEHAKARKRIRELEGKISDYEKSAPDVAKVAAERDNAIARANNAEKDLQLRDLGVTDADDRAFIRERYNMTTKDQGEKAPEFGAWLEGQTETRWFRDAPGGADNPNAEPEARSEYAANKGKPAAKGDEQGGGKGNETPAKKPEQGGGKGAPAKPAFNPNAGTRGNAGAGNGARPAFTREEIKDMTPDEYRANRDAIHTAQREGRIE